MKTDELFNEIEKAIFSTLVIENKQSYNYCREKIKPLIDEFKKEVELEFLTTNQTE